MRSRNGSGRRQLLPGHGPLAGVPPALAFVVVLALFGLGVWWGGVAGAILLGVLAAGVAALLATTWHRLSTPDRVLRVVVLAVLAAVALELVG